VAVGVEPDPRIDPATLREKSIRSAVRLRRVGHDYEEIARRLKIPIETIEAFIAEHLPTHVSDHSKPWHTARRTRLLARQERDDVGPKTMAARYASYMTALNAGDPNALLGSLDDLAVAANAFNERLERQRAYILP
jgi:hypothetical protein